MGEALRLQAYEHVTTTLARPPPGLLTGHRE
jgi:hypothetical protein